MQKPLGFGSFLLEQVLANQHLHQLVPVDLADHAPGAAVVGDIGGVLGEEIPHDLVDGIVAFFVQGIEHTTEDVPHILFVIAGDCKGQGVGIRHGLSLLIRKIIQLLYARKGRV